VEARADLEQAGDAALEKGTPLGRSRNARQDLQERRLARAVAADDAECLALRHVEGDVAQGPHEVTASAVCPVVGLGELECGVGTAAHVRPPAREILPQRRAADLPETVSLRKALDADRGLAHRRDQTVSMNVRSMRLKAITPKNSSTAAAKALYPR